jgi:hypothetical protein
MFTESAVGSSWALYEQYPHHFVSFTILFIKHAVPPDWRYDGMCPAFRHYLHRYFRGVV